MYHKLDDIFVAAWPSCYIQNCFQFHFRFSNHNFPVFFFEKYLPDAVEKQYSRRFNNFFPLRTFTPASVHQVGAQTCCTLSHSIAACSGRVHFIDATALDWKKTPHNWTPCHQLEAYILMFHDNHGWSLVTSLRATWNIVLNIVRLLFSRVGWLRWSGMSGIRFKVALAKSVS